MNPLIFKMTDPTLSTEHRPWPLPRLPWVQAQVWHDLLFAHWPVSPEVLKPHLPEDITLDLWEGEAWVGVVPFWMSGIRIRGLPPFPGASTFPEINVRTYVRFEDKPGVWFFSLDAAHSLAVLLARRGFYLPYFLARMKVQAEGDRIDYSSRRAYLGDPPAAFSGRYRPTSPVVQASPGTLEHWLTERYCLYSASRTGDLYRGDIHHAPWPLQSAEAEFRLNTMAASHCIPLPSCPPILHFSKRLDVRIWPLLRVSSHVSER